MAHGRDGRRSRSRKTALLLAGATAVGGLGLQVTPAAAEPLDPAVAAARQAVVGLLRSTAQEMRGGATANGVLLAEGVAPDALHAPGS